MQGVLCLGIICSSRDPRLLSSLNDGSTGAAASPWVIGIANLGISGLASFVNALILLSGWSCGNAFLYSSSRTLYSLALDGQAPRFFLKCTASGIPIYAVLTVSLIGCLTFLVSSNTAGTVFNWFVDLSTCGFLISYTSMLCIWVGWYRGLKAQGVSRDSLHWKAPSMPYAAYVAIAFGSTVIFFIGLDVFSPFDTEGFVTDYFGVVYALVCFLFWKIFKRTKWVKPEEMDLWSGKAEVDAECAVWEVEGKDQPMTRIGKMWHRMW